MCGERAYLQNRAPQRARKFRGSLQRCGRSPCASLATGAISHQRSRSLIGRGTALRTPPVRVRICDSCRYAECVRILEVGARAPRVLRDYHFEPEALIAKPPPIERLRRVQVPAASSIRPTAVGAAYDAHGQPLEHRHSKRGDGALIGKSAGANGGSNAPVTIGLTQTVPSISFELANVLSGTPVIRKIASKANAASHQ